MVKLKSSRIEAFLKIGIGIFIIILINILANQYFFRIDLTEEKRFTISDATREMLRELDDVVYVEVYLEGDFPAGFKRLQKAIRERLNEFRVYAGTNIQYAFIDPSQATNAEARNEYYRSLAEKGIQPTNLFATEDGKRIEKLIFPGATVSYGGKETGVMLLKGNKASSPEEILNQSVENVEYELAMAIRKLSQTSRKKVALIQGHGELDSLHIAGLTNALLEFYEVYHVNLPEKENLLGYDAIVVAKPDTAFSEQDKFIMDQFIMNGGKAVFLIDALRVNMDSAGNDGTFALPYQLNLNDQLFNYGVRINNDYIQDLNSGAYPVVTGNIGDQPQIRLLPWPFFPIINKFGDHPIVKNMDAVYARFVSSVDTVKAEGIKKTPLLYTSKYSRVLAAPVPVSLNNLRKDIVPENFKDGPVPVAYLLEGKFTSLYENRLLPEGIDQSKFKESGENSKIIVVAEGDLVRNEINYRENEPFALGFDPFTQTNFANDEFIKTAMTYLLEEDGIIQARSKEIKIRPLDKIKIKDEKLKWQIINMVLPILLILIYGVARYYYRKKKYTRY